MDALVDSNFLFFLSLVSRPLACVWSCVVHVLHVFSHVECATPSIWYDTNMGLRRRSESHCDQSPYFGL